MERLVDACRMDEAIDEGMDGWNVQNH